MNSATTWPPTDWAYPEYITNLEAAPHQPPRPMPSADTDDTIPRNLAALVWGAVLGGALLGVLIGSLSAWVAP